MSEAASNGDLSPAALYVRYVLERQGPRRFDEVVAETELPERTVSRALSRLRADDDVVSWPRLNDARERVFATR